VLLFPLYLTSEYVIRRPLGAAIVAAERADVPNKLYDFFAFGPDHKVGFLPVGFVEFGFLPSAGIYAFWDDAIAKGNHVRLHTELWPPDFVSSKVTDRYDYARDRSLEVHFETVTRPDEAFYGIGPTTLDASVSRYTKTWFDGSVAEELRFGRGSQLTGTVGLRRVTTSPGHYADDPSLERAAAAGDFAVPFGFERSYTEPYARLGLRLDSRARGATSGSGIQLQAQGEQGGDVEHVGGGWVRYAGALKATLDLDDHGRLLSLALGALFADPLSSHAIPFTELVSLGGEAWMHGYWEGRLVDRSAAVAALQYAWPVAPWASGLLEVAVGNVFDAHLDGLRPELLRLSPALGLGINGDPPVELLVGVGTETFEHGTQVQSFRLTFGVPRSF
jgi:hypothetical protein